MLQLQRPTNNEIDLLRAAQSQLPFTYEAVGASATTPPTGFTVDHTRVRLGSGESTFAQAKLGLQQWQPFNLGWVDAAPSDAPLSVGTVVIVVARTFGVYSLNAARIVYAIDEPRRFGFAYGTLPGHVEAGEERFQVEWAADDSVWYDIVAFSRPRHLLARLGHWLVRRLQRRFGRDSSAAMQRFVERSARKNTP